MKLTLEYEHGTYSVEEKDVVCLPDVMSLVGQLLRGAGFYFDGEPEIVNEDRGVLGRSEMIDKA
jgi:hypothetical protein